MYFSWVALLKDFFRNNCDITEFPVNRFVRHVSNVSIVLATVLIVITEISSSSKSSQLYGLVWKIADLLITTIFVACAVGGICGWATLRRATWLSSASATRFLLLFRRTSSLLGFWTSTFVFWNFPIMFPKCQRLLTSGEIAIVLETFTYSQWKF